MGRKIPLGASTHIGIATINKPENIDEVVTALLSQIELLSEAVCNSNNNQKYQEFNNTHVNKDGIPVGISLLGTSTRGGVNVLTIGTDGYYVGQNKYGSLSMAAEAVSGVRRSGWAFWRLADGRTAKEAFGRG